MLLSKYLAVCVLAILVRPSQKGSTENAGAGAEQVFGQAKPLCPHLRGEAC